jgi:hypothetical protein
VSELQKKMAAAGHAAYEAKAQELMYTSASPVPWEDVPEPYRSCTLAGYAAALAVVREYLLSDEAVERASLQIDAYVPFTAGAYSVMGEAYRDALSTALGEGEDR